MIDALVGASLAYLRRFEEAYMADVISGIETWGRSISRTGEPRSFDTLRHLAPALEHLRSSGEPALASAIAQAIPHLPWMRYDSYARDRIGAAFADGHAYAPLLDAPDFDLGLFIVGPRVFYRDHHHAAPELYAPLTGPHGWRFKPGDRLLWKPAHVPVWNEPWQPHATMAGDTPFLCLYCWPRHVKAIAEVIPSDDWAALERPA